MTDKHPWDDLETDVPEPGTVTDLDCGIAGEIEQLSSDGEAEDEPTEVNDDFDDEDGDDS